MINEEMRLRYNVVYDADKERVFLIYADTRADERFLTRIIITIDKVVINRGVIKLTNRDCSNVITCESVFSRGEIELENRHS